MKNQQNRQFEPKQTVQKEDGSKIVNLEVYEVFADGFLKAENEQQVQNKTETNQTNNTGNRGHFGLALRMMPPVMIPMTNMAFGQYPNQNQGELFCQKASF